MVGGLAGFRAYGLRSRGNSWRNYDRLVGPKYWRQDRGAGTTAAIFHFEQSKKCDQAELALKFSSVFSNSIRVK
jgi:hypothetical protein